MKRRQWLIDIRTNLGLTQEEVASEAKVDRSTVAKAEAGYDLRITTAKKIAEAVKCDWVLFFKDKSDETGQKTNSA